MFPIDSLWENLIFDICLVFCNLPEYNYVTNQGHVGGFLLIAAKINSVMMVL